MIQLPPSEAPISLERLTRKICASLSMRFAWQFFSFPHRFPATGRNARWLLDWTIQDPASHEFLRASFDDMYEPHFEIGPPHGHSRLEEAGDAFENILARGAAGRLGAYARSLRESSERERRRIHRLFSGAGEYTAYELRRGEQPSCELCRDFKNHLFSTWFFQVAWDWCFIVIWGEAQLAWIGCLTDTD